jgi:hypothetical protein
MSYFENDGFLYVFLFIVFLYPLILLKKHKYAKTYVICYARVFTSIEIYFCYLVYVHSYLSGGKMYLSIHHNHGHWPINIIYTSYTHCTYLTSVLLRVFVYSTFLRFQTFLIEQISVIILMSIGYVIYV